MTQYLNMRRLSVIFVIALLLAIPIFCDDVSASSTVSSKSGKSGLYQVYFNDPTNSYGDNRAFIWTENDNGIRSFDRGSRFDKLVVNFYLDNELLDRDPSGRSLVRFSFLLKGPEGEQILNAFDPYIRDFYDPLKKVYYWSYRGWAGQLQAFAPVGTTMFSFELTIPTYLNLPTVGIYQLEIEFKIHDGSKYESYQTGTIQFMRPHDVDDEQVGIDSLYFHSPVGGDVEGDDRVVIWSRTNQPGEYRQLNQLSSYESVSVRFYAPDYLQPQTMAVVYISVNAPDGTIVKHAISTHTWSRAVVVDAPNVPEGSRMYELKGDFTNPLFLNQNGNYTVQVLLEFNGFVYDKLNHHFAVQYYEFVADHVGAILWIIVLILPALILGMIFSIAGFGLGLLMMSIALLLFGAMPIWVLITSIIGVSIIFYRKSKGRW